MPLRILFCFIAALLFAPNIDASAQERELVKLVVLSRHGVRSPTQSDKVLEMWSQKPWPEWPVAKGELTPRGARLVSAMWANLKPYLAENGALPENACPRQADIYVRADVDERDKATAAAILAGLAPDCKLGFVASSDKIDPLFHPVKAGLYKYDPIPAATSVLAMTHGGLGSLQDEFAGALAVIDGVAGSPNPSLCSRFALMPKCQIADLPTAISISADGANIRIVGALGVASSLAEIFLLEYGQWPDSPAGWGEVNARVLGQILPVHSKVFDIVNRAPVVSWANGASLLREMTAALMGEHYDPRVNEAKIAMFVGHDTNIANVGGLLDFYWQASGYPPNGIPPASALFLELWRAGDSLEVVASFYSQSPDALHAPFNDSEANLKEHAPRATHVFSGQSYSPAAMGATAFVDKVNQITSGAPQAPAQKPPYEYAKAE